jgi:hypothetical protein
VSKQDSRPVEARLEAAFDRFNRAVILGMEPTPVMFMDALEAEGLQLRLTVPETLDDPAAAAAPRTKLTPRRARALF